MKPVVRQWLAKRGQRDLLAYLTENPDHDYVVIGRGEEVPDLELSLRFHEEFEPMSYRNVPQKYHMKNVVRIGEVGTAVVKRVDPLVAGRNPMVSDNPLYTVDDKILIFVLWQQRMGYLTNPPTHGEKKTLLPAINLPELGPFYATEWAEYVEAQDPLNRETMAGRAYRWAFDNYIWTPPQEAGKPSTGPFDDSGERPSTEILAFIRDEMVTLFNDEELRTFAFDRYRPVYENFSGSMSKSQKLQMIVETVSSIELAERLLALIAEYRPVGIETLLRKAILKRYSDEALRTFCADLGVDYSSLPAQGREGKARELVAEMRRKTNLAILISKVARF